MEREWLTASEIGGEFHRCIDELEVTNARERSRSAADPEAVFRAFLDAYRPMLPAQP